MRMHSAHCSNDEQTTGIPPQYMSNGALQVRSARQFPVMGRFGNRMKDFITKENDIVADTPSFVPDSQMI